MRRLPFLLCCLLFLGGTASAQICVSELRAALTDLSDVRPATGVDAALLLRRAVELVEPGLPPLRKLPDSRLPVAADAPHADTVRYLAERRLLPKGWTPEALDADTWAGMLNAFRAWYKLPAMTVRPPDTLGPLLLDASVALEDVSHAIRPAALLASDPGDRDRLAFWAIIWNWTVYPRLLVLRPRSDVTLAQGPGAVLQHMGNCAVHVRSYVLAPEDTAKRLFLTTNQSRMYVVGSVPDRDGAWPRAVPEGDELAAFDFRAPEVQGLRLYTAVFEGPSVGVGTMFGLLTQLRTNVSPAHFLSFMQMP